MNHERSTNSLKSIQYHPISTRNANDVRFGLLEPLISWAPALLSFICVVFFFININSFSKSFGKVTNVIQKNFSIDPRHFMFLHYVQQVRFVCCHSDFYRSYKCKAKHTTMINRRWCLCVVHARHRALTAWPSRAAAKATCVCVINDHRSSIFRFMRCDARVV